MTRALAVLTLIACGAPCEVPTPDRDCTCRASYGLCSAFVRKDGFIHAATSDGKTPAEVTCDGVKVENYEWSTVPE